ncbi:hypothetical protein [Pseudomonas sp. 2(2015)]|uniref:hypothetical protein n=1 Tax=Pseudomonas sp. 2(2015) TaxID=1619950 RepID=UPI0009E4711A|nr:hypothetical protein [Pseudomonas sp. 2(2015)]
MAFFSLKRPRRWLFGLALASVVVGLPVGCAVLEHKERELLFRIEPGNASWYRGMPAGVQELELRPESFKAGQNIHAWWWPAKSPDAAAILYLHGVRWNLTGQLFRIQQLHNAAAQPPKRLLLVPGATHNNSMSLAGQRYRQAIEAL